MIFIYFLSVLFAGLCCTFAQQPPSLYHSEASSTTPVAIIEQQNVHNSDGSFNNSFVTADGIKVQNSGYLKKIQVPQHDDENGPVPDHQEEILVQTGSFSYLSPDGSIITLTYIADEKGFQPFGDHLPKSPSDLTPLTQTRPLIDLANQKPILQDAPFLQQNRPIQTHQQLTQQQGRPIQVPQELLQRTSAAEPFPGQFNQFG